MTIQLADRSIKYPRGVIDDIVVEVGKFKFPVDFVVMDMHEESDVPLILGRPFLATAGALTDSSAGELTLRVGDDKVAFKVKRAMKKSHEHDDACVIVDSIGLMSIDCEQGLLAGDALERVLTQSEDWTMVDKEYVEQVNFLGCEASKGPKTAVLSCEEKDGPREEGDGIG